MSFQFPQNCRIVDDEFFSDDAVTDKTDKNCLSIAVAYSYKTLEALQMDKDDKALERVHCTWGMGSLKPFSERVAVERRKHPLGCCSQAPRLIVAIISDKLTSEVYIALSLS